MIQVMTPYAMALMLNDIRADLITAPGLLMKLFQNNIVPTPQNVLADFTVATFDGYVDKAVTLLFGPSRQPDGSFRIYAFQNWVQTGSVTPNQIYGFYVLDRLGALILAQRFNDPVAMIDAFSTLTTEFQLNLPPNGISGNPQPL